MQLRRTRAPARPGPWAVSSRSIPRGETDDPKPQRYSRLTHKEGGTVRERGDTSWSLLVDGRALLPLFSDSAGRSLVKEETSKRLCPHVHSGGRVPGVCGII